MTPWKEELQKELIKKYGAKKGAVLVKKYLNAFPLSYRDECSVEVALQDIFYLEKLSSTMSSYIDFYKIDNTENPLHLRVYQYGKQAALSDILPMIENMDLRTFSEQPYLLTLGNRENIWISDFSVSYKGTSVFNLQKVKTIFQEAFAEELFGFYENDGFNKLVIGAELSWREINILRAYAKYLHQIGFRFSQFFIEKTLAKNPEISGNLIQLFITKFDPKQKSNAKKDCALLNEKIQQALEKVTSLDEDRVLRYLWLLIKATLRTNYFQTTAEGKYKEYFCFKLSSNDVPELPLPHPLYEIFVYSPRFEGIHLRAEKVARGGIRWSDRLEDFRTEILGLMKAQKVKNAVIVPSGAKGGFVLKALPELADRQTIQTELVYAYKSFIRGLLDLTDNLKDGKVIRPKDVVCYDDNDTYLVVAADKGTASFSDTANEISKEYDFWLGDAFASGGSEGYDHKKIGITARGAWESIKRHFHELEIDVENTDITVVGIGDMSGDVFGNGMIYSKHIKLVAAFDHRNIFIDPNPDAQQSFAERLRLFNLPISSWENYNSKLISAGGGIFKRSSKSISLSAEMKKLLQTEENSLTPNELICALLKAPVDLLYNGGVGTYVKATSESHADVGDKTNEYCRINGNELRCRVVCEGGNLGFTQLGRIEYALTGGLIYTDFIDNSAGVDCSDHEVNIKILLDKEVKKGKLTKEKRNQLLVSMTDEVAKSVLKDNFHQALTMSFSAVRAQNYVGLHQEYLLELEHSHDVDRAVEYLPDDKKLLERKAAGQGLTRPELAVLFAYTKIHIKNAILLTSIPEDPYLSSVLITAFPETLQKTYAKAIQEHSLRREIVATQLSNKVVNEMGITFVYRLQMETGAGVGEIIRSYVMASQIFQSKELEKIILSLDFKVALSLQYELLHHVRHLVNLATRWFLRSNRHQQDLSSTIADYGKRVDVLKTLVPNLMSGVTKTYLETLVKNFADAGIEKEIAQRVAACRAMYISLNVIETAMRKNFNLEKTAEIYFNIGKEFNLVWFRDQIAADNREGHWITLSRLALRDELDVLQKQLTVAVIQHNSKIPKVDKMIENWIAANQLVMERWKKVLELLHSSSNIDSTMYFVSLRELSNLLN